MHVCFFISQQKHLLWLLKRMVSMRPKTSVKMIDGYKGNDINFTLKNVAFLDLRLQ